MYPETDVPPVTPDPGDIDPPELLTDRVDRYVDELGLDRDLAEQVAYGERMPQFERAVELGVDPALAARTLASTLTALRRDDVPVKRVTDDHLEAIFELVAAGELTQEGVEALLEEVAAAPELSAEEAADRAGLGTAGEDEIRETIVAVVEAHDEQVAEEGMGAFSALMGECMAELRGKAEGELVSDILRTEIQKRAAP